MSHKRLVVLVLAAAVAAPTPAAAAQSSTPSCKTNPLAAARPPLDLSPISPSTSRRLVSRDLPANTGARARRCLLPSFSRANVIYRPLATSTTSVRRGQALGVLAKGLRARRGGEDARMLLAGPRYGTENAVEVVRGRAATTVRIPVHAPKGIYYIAVADLIGYITPEGKLPLWVTRVRVR